MTGQPMQSYVIKWYATFYDERGDQLDRVHVGDGKIAIPLLATYMKFDAEVKSVSGTPHHASPEKPRTY